MVYSATTDATTPDSAEQLAGSEPAGGAERSGGLEQWAGTEWMIDALGCDEQRLRDLALVRQICDQVVADLSLRVVGDPHTHRFPSPGGVTAMYLLSESHLTCHTYPEHRLATFNLYCCRSREAWPWAEQLLRRLQASEVVVTQMPRGMIATSGAGQ
jgi:S-adenosylmethionine decarboxylase